MFGNLLSWEVGSSAVWPDREHHLHCHQLQGSLYTCNTLSLCPLALCVPLSLPLSRVRQVSGSLICLPLLGSDEPVRITCQGAGRWLSFTMFASQPQAVRCVKACVLPVACKSCAVQRQMYCPSPARIVQCHAENFTNTLACSRRRAGVHRGMAVSRGLGYPGYPHAATQICRFSVGLSCSPCSPQTHSIPEGGSQNPCLYINMTLVTH